MPVPDRADKDKFDADTLNPLLNPLLASHMGRWAEVYFTNPPEKREEAVSDLLRELGDVPVPATASVQGAAAANAEEYANMVDSLHSSSSTVQSTAEPVHPCSVCAYNNSAGHSFCGMCGAPLQLSPETTVPHDLLKDVPQDVSQQVPPVEESTAIAGRSWYERSLDPNSVEETIEPALSFSANAAHEPSGDPEASWLRPEKNPPHRAVESEPAPNRYRLYIGAVLAILLASFAYGAWRGTKDRTASTASTPASASAQPTPVHSAPPKVATMAPSPTPTPPASPVQDQNRPGAHSPGGQAADSPIAAQTLPVAPTSSAVTAGQSGAGELAIAEQYLNGTSGMTRDSGEAAQWLWKAVRKRNVEATLALSDLYLRGDGVPKSCDQARLLLDAAARKGAPAAAERLHQLETSNCN
jgi:hypothetical protein